MTTHVRINVDIFVLGTDGMTDLMNSLKKKRAIQTNFENKQTNSFFSLVEPIDLLMFVWFLAEMLIKDGVWRGLEPK